MSKLIERICKCPSVDGMVGSLLYFNDGLCEISLTGGYNDIDFDCNVDHRTLEVKLFGENKMEWKIDSLNLTERGITVKLERIKSPSPLPAQTGKEVPPIAQAEPIPANLQSQLNTLEQCFKDKKISLKEALEEVKNKNV